MRGRWDGESECVLVCVAGGSSEGLSPRCIAMADHRDWAQVTEQPAACRAVRLQMTSRRRGERGGGDDGVAAGFASQRGSEELQSEGASWSAGSLPRGTHATVSAGSESEPRGKAPQWLGSHPEQLQEEDIRTGGRQQKSRTCVSVQGEQEPSSAGGGERRAAEPGMGRETWQDCCRDNRAGGRWNRASLVASRSPRGCSEGCQPGARAPAALRRRNVAVGGILGALLHLLVLAPVAPETFNTISPLQAPASGSGVTTILGTGFTPQTSYSCRFTDVRRPGNRVDAAATFLSATELSCAAFSWLYPAAATLVSLRANSSIEVRALTPPTVGR